jgi:hypothetical protein
MCRIGGRTNSALIRSGGLGLKWRSCGTPGGGCRSRALSKILFQFLARLEVRNAFGWHIHGFARLGIATATWASFASAETAKPAQLDFFTFVKRADYGVEHGFDYHFCIALVQLSRPSHFLHKFCLSHLSPVSRKRSAACSFDLF